MRLRASQVVALHYVRWPVRGRSYFTSGFSQSYVPSRLSPFGRLGLAEQV
jgi:hypothetical protein